jgi:DNA gyrase subunit A
MDVVQPNGLLLIVTTNGFGKQTPLKEYTPKGRATGGIATIDQKALPITGRIASARVVQNDDDLTIITANGVTLRLKVKNVKQSGRSTRGVHLMKPQEGDSIATVARIAAEDLVKAGAQADENGENVEEKEQPKLI